jgi:hypothetical protein
MPNIVYVLANEAMPGLVKIGITDGLVEDRISQLNTSGVPLPFECYYAAEVDDKQRVEKILHQLFSEYRINLKREFFRMNPEKVILALSIGNFKEVVTGEVVVDAEEKAALEKAKSRRPNIKLSAIGIQPGATLTFSRDESRKAIVAENNKIIYAGETTSLSAAALKIMNEMGYKTPAVSGSEHWMFEGELLDDRRQRIEEEQFDQKPYGSDEISN